MQANYIERSFEAIAIRPMFIELSAAHVYATKEHADLTSQKFWETSLALGFVGFRV